MTKLVLVLSFVGLAITLAFGLLDPTNPIMWLSSTTGSFAILRASLMAIILALLVTEPPRNMYLRLFVGFVSVGIVGWSITATYQNTMQIGDGILLLSTGFAMAITVLERTYEESIKLLPASTQ